MQRLFFHEFAGDIYSNSQGKATNIISLNIGFEREAYQIAVTWKIANPDFGTDICKAIELIPPQGR
jgi:hypothetical protein